MHLLGTFQHTWRSGACQCDLPSGRRDTRAHTARHPAASSAREADPVAWSSTHDTRSHVYSASHDTEHTSAAITQSIHDFYRGLSNTNCISVHHRQ